MTGRLSSQPTPPRAWRRLWRWGLRLLPQLLRFGTVGGLAFVIDVGLMNLLRFGPGAVLGDKPLTAKVISVSVAIVFAWLGNRYWAFADTRRSGRSRELLLFVVVNLGGMAIAVGCLAISHYVLGFTSPLADNISANGVGLVLGTIFRYVCYRFIVFTGDRAEVAAPVDDDAAAALAKEMAGRGATVEEGAVPDDSLQR